MQSGIPNETEVLEYFNTLSNWNRWGSNDQLGTLNFLSEESTLKAIKEIRYGKTISCAERFRGSHHLIQKSHQSISW